uniref:Uncharacterized protein n=1 Tax=Candidatus Kentrum sp. FM TaxID=2126340 RepID=A0A450VMQ7_9GAMM|nr:MAG: hypothetical protein BECKFM1743A_GA0114220_1001410 [Candidatus Kentron sp. FM]VFJ44529.1 MAG: hypothetical protein BECKFM1743C_GA0114222_1001212 [Candidatus Kentron sp. FM]VFK05990.1 MAG: hypothetical protein BECKFM1743B_GA0114221_1000816 [Candidatus Kentron sp. FM]
MMPRESTTKFKERWLQGSGERIAFIPDLRVLEFLTPRECIAAFQQDWDDANTPQAVCLPLIGVDGVAFPNDLCDTGMVRAKIGPGRAPEEKPLGQIAKEFADAGANLYLYICPSMEFLQVEACHVLDIRNSGSPSACVHKEKTQELMKYLIGAGLDHVQESLGEHEARIQGLAIDITDLWGMGGEEGKLYPTCFCEECREDLKEQGVELEQFETYPNPWNLALEVSESGISYIDNLSRNEAPANIRGKSALRGFGTAFGSEAEKLDAAHALMRYMLARHGMVEAFLSSVFEEARVYPSENEARPLRKIAVCEGSDYDWTAGVFPPSLSPKIIDELWLDPADKLPSIPLPHKMFLWRRATYFLNAFFEMLSNAADGRMRTTTGLARLSEEGIKQRLHMRGAQALHNELRGARQLAALPALKDGGRNGFVGVVFSERLLEDLLREPHIAPGLAQETGSPDLSSLLPGLLAQLTGAAGPEDD